MRVTGLSTGKRFGSGSMMGRSGRILLDANGNIESHLHDHRCPPTPRLPRK